MQIESRIKHNAQRVSQSGEIENGRERLAKNIDRCKIVSRGANEPERRRIREVKIVLKQECSVKELTIFKETKRFTYIDNFSDLDAFERGLIESSTIYYYRNCVMDKTRQ